jgi:hypothetical protein
MTKARKRIVSATMAIVCGLGALMASDHPLGASGIFVTGAQAIIGRPLTPMSYAGVARRTTRRAYYGAAAYGGAAVGAAAVGAAAYGAAAAVAVHPGCVQVVGPYGGWTWRCY